MGSIEWSLPISKTGNNVNGAKKEELTQVIAKRMMKSRAGGYKGMDSVEWLSPNSRNINNVYGAKKEELTQVIAKRDKRISKFNIIGGYGNSGLDQFSTSTVATTSKYIDYDKLRWKWIATGGMKNEPCGYFSYIRC
ncbi:uncharacterized protein LOC111034048 [Myzus persicae]|uniref:uncharacterized protein LOC111034048 n=1 Tax=Myzus persicae TaxID=13164 RepID=UPI000B931D46|nr:uncharacterized protein LOC111034048 [Myzus persicae]